MLYWQAVDCPQCRLTNPPNAVRCDCGYNFDTGAIEPIARQVHYKERASSQSPLKKAFWPDIYDEHAAMNAARYGFWAAVLCSAATALLAVLGHLHLVKTTEGLVSVLDAAVFALIAIGIYRHRRLAAVCGLVLYLVERVSMWSEVGPANAPLVVILTLAFINSVRGTLWLSAHKREQRVAANAEPRQS